MKSIVVILSLMGCDDSAKNCESIQASNVTFESQEACLRASEDVFETHSDAAYPLVLAKCDIKTPSQIASRPANEAESEDLAMHADEDVPVELSAQEIAEEGWFRLTLSNTGKAIASPIVGAANTIVKKSANAAIWVCDRAKSALDTVNPF